MVLLGALTAIYMGLAVRLYFFPPIGAVVGSLIGLALAGIALVYLLSTRAVLRQSRLAHIVAIVVCALAVLLGVSTPDLTWLEGSVIAVNLSAAVMLGGCLPRKPTTG